MGTHYKKLINPDYLGAYSLDDGNNGYLQKDATIKYVQMQDVVNPQGKKEQKLVAFTTLEKPFILNRTAQKTLSRIAKSNYIENWKNIPVTFYVEKNVKAFGDVVDALRVKPSNKSNSPVPNVGYSNLEMQLKNCTTIEQLASCYMTFNNVEKAALLQLKDELKAKLQRNENN